MQAFVPKNRKPKFDLTLRIIDLTNIPLVCGTASVKWHLTSSNTAEHRGRTDKSVISDHKATWEYSKELSVRMTIEKNQALQECELQFEIVQEYDESVKGSRVLLGTVKLNLAEYTQLHELSAAERDPQDESEDGGITRRYLLQDSKINCTLKIGIKMKQTEGDTSFTAPPLKPALVIGGIAGVLSAEVGDGEDMPTLTSKTRELSEAQDLYRRTLAASWACQHGELAPDKLIEDLFAGGDGGRMAPPTASPNKLLAPVQLHSRDDSLGSSSSDADSRRTIMPGHLTPEMARRGHGHRHGSGFSRDGGSEAHHSDLLSSGGINGRGSIDQQMQGLHKEHRKRKSKEHHRMTEYDVREDLRSWQVRVR